MGDKLYEKFDALVNQIVIYAQAASVNSKVDCIYPESFMIGILTSGANEVTTALLELKVDLEHGLKIIKKELSSKFKNNEISQPDFDELKISRQLHDACKCANKIRTEIFISDKINIKHIFLALLRTSDFLNCYFKQKGVTEASFIGVIKSSKVKEPAGTDHKRKEEGSALASYCENLTQKAKDKKLDPVIAREKEIETAITILCRRSKNNPILLGEPGVGKSAIVEGIAQRIVSGTVPKQLLNHKLYSLSLASMVAGTKYRGEFEERIQILVKEIQASTDCILFIDEIHTLVGAGSGSGALDASNILKPFLARSDLKCIGATTLEDYKKYLEKEGALARRFQQVMVEEPNRDQMKLILKEMRPKFEEWHNCKIEEAALEMAINLCDRYVKDRNFPDKALDCLDMACAKQAWGNEKNKKIITKDIAQVISEQCSIPLEVILWDDSERIKKIKEMLSTKVIGQEHAIDTLCRVLKNAYSGIRNPDRPIGNFVFGGQSGTGKTYAAKELAKAVFGKESLFLKLDMTEFSEQHSVSKLIGSPPGYVGFQETDRFIDRIKRNPYCIVLLDEFEKAHPDVLKLFLQVMSDGIMTDASGNKASFKNVVLIMTGNFGMDSMSKGSLGFNRKDNKNPFTETQDKLTSYCKEKYGNEFINRVDEFIPFMPLDDNSLKKIIEMRLEEVNLRLVDRNCKLKFNDNIYDLLIKMSKKEHGGNATILNRLISKKIEPCISDALIAKTIEFCTIEISAKNDDFIYNINDNLPF